MPLSERVYCVAITFKMTEQVEQRICIRFYVKPEHPSVEIIQMTQKALGHGTMSAAQIKSMAQTLQRGQESVESDPCSGRPATSRTPGDVESVQTSINKGQPWTVAERARS